LKIPIYSDFWGTQSRNIKLFLEYPDADFTVIHRDNIEDLLLFRE